jgi:hypothetical protein
MRSSPDREEVNPAVVTPVSFKNEGFSNEVAVVFLFFETDRIAITEVSSLFPLFLSLHELRDELLVVIFPLTTVAF